MTNAPQVPAVQARLEQTLAQWRQWRCHPPLPGSPHLQRRLHGGLSNHNFLVKAAQRQFVVRIDGISPQQHGLSRQVENCALETAAATGIAPQPCYFNPELGALVSQYLPPDKLQGASAEELAALCLGIHTLPARHHRLDLEARIRRYRTHIKRAGKPSPAARLSTRIDALLPRCQTSEPVLCHNDLLPANLLRSNNHLYALDWEYCAMGNRWFDLAIAGDGQHYSEDEFGQFLSAYLSRPANASDWQQLAVQRALYRYLELLWHLVQAEPKDAGAILAQRQPPLEALLD